MGLVAQFEAERVLRPLTDYLDAIVSGVSNRFERLVQKKILKVCVHTIHV